MWIILGAGRSGLGAKKLLMKSNCENQILFYDENPSKAPEELKSQIIQNPHDPILFDKTTSFVVSPGFSLTHPILAQAKNSGQKIISEIDLALENYKGKLLAITGTNGKSTTVMMTAHILKLLKISFEVGGNIGISASAVVSEHNPKYLLLELSSYQIEASELIKPKIGILMSITPDHLARHQDLEGYFKAKWKIFAKQTPTDFAIIEANTYKQAREIFKLPNPLSKIVLIEKKETEILKNHLNFAWEHDFFNALCALHLASELVNRPIEDLAPLLLNYRGLPFRCEIIGKVGQWKIVNDSKSTSVDSTLHALSNAKGKITLFLGGLGKGESFREILNHSRNVKSVVAFGKSGPQIFKDLSEKIPVTLHPTLAKGMEDIELTMKNLKGDLIFSPGCASQDEFSDFEERGSYFTSQVHRFLKSIPGGLEFEPIYKAKKT